MCNLIKPSDKKTVTIYKAVIKIKENYYSYYAGTKIKIGKVKPQTLRDYERIAYKSSSADRFTLHSSNFYNKRMVGKMSGFKNISSAYLIGNSDIRRVLKIVLGGEIWEGNTHGISWLIPHNEIVYAGSEIISFEEI